MVRKNKKTKNLFKRYRKLVVLTLLVIGALVIYALAHKDTSPYSNSTVAPNTHHSTNPQPDNYNYPSAEQPNNPKTQNPHSNIPNNSGQKKVVAPIITSASHEGQYVVVRSYVNEVFENGGTCTAVFSKDNISVSGASKGFENASYTTCAPIKIPGSKFYTSGNWTLIVRYSSPTSEGVSQSQIVKVK